MVRAAETGDRVEIDYQGTIDGKPFAGGDAKGYILTLGEGRTLKDFEGAIVGMKPGETRSVQVAFPADYHGTEVAGKIAVFELRLNRVLEPRLPEIGADFARALGVDDGDVHILEMRRIGQGGFDAGTQEIRRLLRANAARQHNARQDRRKGADRKSWRCCLCAARREAYRLQ